MPFPLAPFVPIVIRLGLVAGAGLAAQRLWAATTQVGRTDQRAEDALDDLGEGLAVHRPADRAADGGTQTNTAGRIVRTIRIGRRRIEIDAAFLGRLRIRKR